MLGRYAAGFVAAVLLMIIPVKYKGVSVAGRTESMVTAALDGAYREIRLEGMLTREILEKMISGIALSGIPYEIEIEIGTVLTGKNTKELRIMYTSEIMEQIDKSGSIAVYNCLVTLKAIPLRKGIGEKTANLLWDSYIPEKIEISGGYIYG
ncbi:MAG: hypothetical protein IKP88_12420 [Lachnospiraceae bacterium]|nr:hypothetical protein [Lachnospiraceae bacterium]